MNTNLQKYKHLLLILFLIFGIITSNQQKDLEEYTFQEALDIDDNILKPNKYTLEFLDDDDFDEKIHRDDKPWFIFLQTGKYLNYYQNLTMLEELCKIQKCTENEIQIRKNHLKILNENQNPNKYTYGAESGPMKLSYISQKNSYPLNKLDEIAKEVQHYAHVGYAIFKARKCDLGPVINLQLATRFGLHINNQLGFIIKNNTVYEYTNFFHKNKIIQFIQNQTSDFYIQVKPYELPSKNISDLDSMILFLKRIYYYSFESGRASLAGVQNQIIIYTVAGLLGFVVIVRYLLKDIFEDSDSDDKKNKND